MVAAASCATLPRNDADIIGMQSQFLEIVHSWGHILATDTSGGEGLVAAVSAVIIPSK